MRLGAPELQSAILADGSYRSPIDIIASLRSRYPNPTNAQALAALEMFGDRTVEEVRGALPGDSLTSAATIEYLDAVGRFLLPDGVLPRMRLLAWGWTQPGDKFKSPADGGWWKRIYDYPLWNVIDTYILYQQGDLYFDHELAAGDQGELSRSLAAVVQYDLPPVQEAPCPRYLIPPGKRQLPIPNPACVKLPGRIPPTVPTPPAAAAATGWGWLLVLLLLLDEE